MLKEHYQDGCHGICNKPWLHIDSTLMHFPSYWPPVIIEHYEEDCIGGCNRLDLSGISLGVLCDAFCFVDETGFCWYHGTDGSNRIDYLDDYLCQTGYKPESITARCVDDRESDGIHGRSDGAGPTQVRLNMEVNATRPDHDGAVVRKPRRQRIRK